MENNKARWKEILKTCFLLSPTFFSFFHHFIPVSLLPLSTLSSSSLPFALASLFFFYFLLPPSSFIFLSLALLLLLLPSFFLSFFLFLSPCIS